MGGIECLLLLLVLATAAKAEDSHYSVGYGDGDVSILSRVKRQQDDWSDPRGEDAVKEVDIAESRINETLEANMSGDVVEQDERKYYESGSIDYASAWVDLDRLNKTVSVKEHPMLSKSYRRAATVSLSFAFPFYGHDVSNITIATGGFLYTGQYVHSWLAATQYIAPLMANFDTSMDDDAKIRYADNGTSFIVEWDNVNLQRQHSPDNSNSSSSNQTIDMEDGPFTFQVILHANGDIVFAYKSVPLRITNIEDAEHPVKVGLSDAYIIDRTIFFVKRKTIYEYHRVSLTNSDVANETAIYFKALSTCNRKKSCDSCLTDADSAKLQCKWCPQLKQCSDGVDRNRQHWIKSGCDQLSPEIKSCKAAAEWSETTRMVQPRRHEEEEDLLSPSAAPQPPLLPAPDESKGSSYHAGVGTIVVIALLLLSIVAWFGYAYFFPHTWSGQLLIKYRPSRWHWLRGEPRYTAAAIHM